MIKDIFKQGKPVVSCEVFPPKRDSEQYEVFETLDKISEFHPDYISVTYGAGGSTNKKTVRIASYIQNICDVESIVHLTSVAMTEELLAETVAELEKKAIHNILVLRGDRPRDMSDEAYANRKFHHATDLVELVKKASDSEFCFAGACYPEKHPESVTVEEDLKFLKLKQDMGIDFLISQMFFDNDKYFRFIEGARKAGITIPIEAGIMPITAAKQLGTSVQLSGSSVPTQMSNMIAKYADNPEDMKKAGIEYALNQIRGLMDAGVDGVHIYSMNKADVTGEIFRGIGR